MEEDRLVRAAAFKWLAEQVKIHGDTLLRPLLQKGFLYRRQRISLVSPSGIFKPRMLNIPLSITTSPDDPYGEHIENGFIIYKYRNNGGPNHRDNVGLRTAFEQRVPLVYLYGLVPGLYFPCWPVYIVGDEPQQGQFKVMVDECQQFAIAGSEKRMVAETVDSAKAYTTAKIKVRLYQRKFRERVLAAYQTQCAFCRLRHEALLDAGHIVPDSEPHSSSTVDNGMALCKLHHAAFDNFMLGVTPDFRIHVRADILEETDGPMLKHGLKELHRTKIVLPAAKSERPGRAALEWRYERFICGSP